MDFLPTEILAEILPNLPLQSLLQCRSINKTWRNTIDSLRSTNKLKKSSFIFLTSDCRSLYIVQEEDESTHSFKSTKINFSPPPHCSLRLHKPYSDGFLCFSPSSPISDWRSYIYSNPRKGLIKLPNPTTIGYLKLPSFNSHVMEACLVSGFGFDSFTHNYKMVQIFMEEGRVKIEAQILTIGSNTWRKLQNVPQLLFSKASSAVVKGCLYWVTGDKRLVSFNLTSEAFKLVEVPEFSFIANSESKFSRVDNLRVVELGGCLSISDSSYVHHAEIWILKDGSWGKVSVFKAYTLNGVFFDGVVPVSVLKNGEIVLLYNSRVLVAYNVEKERYTPFHILGVPGCRYETLRRPIRHCYEVYPYVGSSLSPLCNQRGED